MYRILPKYAAYPSGYCMSAKEEMWNYLATLKTYCCIKAQESGVTETRQA